jgi:hypothetical protein
MAEHSDHRHRHRSVDGFVLNLCASEMHVRYALTHDLHVAAPQLLRSMGQQFGTAILPGNRIKAMHNGEHIFPGMLDSIRGAKKPACGCSAILPTSTSRCVTAKVLSERLAPLSRLTVLLVPTITHRLQVVAGCRRFLFRRGARGRPSLNHTLPAYGLESRFKRGESGLMAVDVDQDEKDDQADDDGDGDLDPAQRIFTGDFTRGTIHSHLVGLASVTVG